MFGDFYMHLKKQSNFVNLKLATNLEFAKSRICENEFAKLQILKYQYDLA